ncbi:hypothetical protein [Microbacterium sp. TNHR37B]|uniref:hypothetical protein n=1 Tax=Microbacterium sp. TNHR37B TaxID=1775956 RepID=UPI0007B2F9B0|nr:hypothetical protein [Microbacterium sp. TNHR37B]KZE90607.1 hypothetical protein AVP41_00126 [Microbacterium sp. TNHR37B]
MRRKTSWAAAASLPLVLLVSACTASPGVDPGSVTGVPEPWRTTTAEGWPSSAGHQSGTPVMSRGKCLLADSPPEILDETGTFTDSGWGPFGDDASGYRYICSLWKPDAYAGELQLIQAASAEAVATTVEQFRTQKSSRVQENTVTEVTSGKLDLWVLTRWYPTNPQGRYQALYHDEDSDTIVTLEINSLDEKQFATLTPQDVADALVGMMAQAS